MKPSLKFLLIVLVVHVFACKMNDNQEFELSKAEVDCGTVHQVTSTRIANADSAQRHSRPWYIDLRTNKADTTTSRPRKCSASVVPVKGDKYKSDILLSSATCVAAGLNHKKIPYHNYDAYLIQYDDAEFKFQAYAALHKETDIVQGNPLEIEKIFHHSYYVAVNGMFQYDIALIKLARPLSFGKTIRPICLPKEDESPSGKECVFNGFDRSPLLYIDSGKELQNLEVTVRSAEACTTNRPSRYESYTKEDDEKMICATSNKRDGRVGQEDIGGPLACVDEVSHIPVWSLFGILTITQQFQGDVRPLICARVPFHNNWIVDLANYVTSVSDDRQKIDRMLS